MGLHRVVQHDLGRVLARDDDVGLREPPFEIAALAHPRLADQLPARHRFIGIGQHLELLEVDLDRVQRRAGLRVGVRAHRRDRGALEAAFVVQDVEVVRPEGCMHAGRRECRREVDAADAGMGIGRAQHGGVQHPRQLQVGCVDGLASRALEAVDARCRPADDLERPGGPLLQRVLFDDEPDLLVTAFDFLLGADQSCHVRIASSIFGYVPQRQRLPAMLCRISSVVGFGVAVTSATALTICPGVQKPH